MENANKYLVCYRFSSSNGGEKLCTGSHSPVTAFGWVAVGAVLGWDDASFRSELRQLWSMGAVVPVKMRRWYRGGPNHTYQSIPGIWNANSWW